MRQGLDEVQPAELAELAQVLFRGELPDLEHDVIELVGGQEFHEFAIDGRVLLDLVMLRPAAELEMRAESHVGPVLHVHAGDRVLRGDQDLQKGSDAVVETGCVRSIMARFSLTPAARTFF